MAPVLMCGVNQMEGQLTKFQGPDDWQLVRRQSTVLLEFLDRLRSETKGTNERLWQADPSPCGRSMPIAGTISRP